MSLSKDKVYLMKGLGCRLNTILNHIDRLDEITFVWADPRECGATWEELFSFPKLNVIYKNPIPYDDEGIQQFRHFKSTSFIENSHTRKYAPQLMKYLYMDHLLEFSTDPNFIYECVKARNHFIYQHNKTKLKAAQQFIKSLVPSKQVAKLMPYIPEGTDGYAIRLLHPNSMVKKPIKVPSGSFISTDSEEQLRFSPQTIQTPGVGGTYDKDPNIQDKQGAIRAAADWFSLFKCKKIFEVGLPFNSLADHPHRGHSTFIDCHRILGCDMENYVNNNYSFTKK